MADSYKNTNYVKFVRGSVSAFNQLKTKNADTLYFVYEDTDAQTGTLYLGEKLISGGIKSLDQLQDIVTTNVADGDLLVYSEEHKKWIATSVSEAFKVSPFTGAEQDKDGRAGLVPTPTAGQQDLFLQANGTWSHVNAISLNLDNDIFESSSTGSLQLKDYSVAAFNSVPVKTKNGLDWVETYSKTEIDSLLSNVSSRLSRKLVDSIEDIDLEKAENLNYIFMIPNFTDEDLNNYDEYVIVELPSGEKVLEKLSSGTVEIPDIDLSNFVTTETFELHTVQTGDLNTLIKYKTDATLVEQVNHLTERMTWHEISEEENN